MFDTMCFAGAA